MKKMSCRQLGGACETVFSAETFEEMVQHSKTHAMDMAQKGDQSHLQKMQEMGE